MMLTILTGPARSGKSERILGRMKALAEAGRPSLLIVPESDSHQAERRMLQVCGNGGGRYAAVGTFSKLAGRLLREAGVRPRTLDAGGNVLHMYRALTACHSALRYFRRAPRPQLIARLLETRDELIAGGVTPSVLLDAARRGGFPDKIHDLALIFSAFEAQVRNSGLEPRDPFDIACDLMPHSTMLRDLHIFIDGFSGFTAQRRQAIGHMMSFCESVTVSLLLGEDTVLFTQQDKTCTQLLKLAEAAEIEAEVDALPPPPARLLERLAVGAFDYSVSSVSVPQDALALYTCLSPREESELAAVLARRWVLEDGARARGIAVVCSDLDTYGPLVENAFARYGVPLFLSRAEDVLQKPPMAAVLGMLAILEQGYTTESVVAWLKSGLSGIDSRACHMLENYALTWNLRGSAWKKSFTLKTTGYGNPVPDEEARLAELEAVRLRVAAPLEALAEALAVCETGGALAEVLARYLAHSGFPEALEARMAELAEGGRPRQASQYAQLWDILQAALGQMQSALAEESMPLRDFIRLLRLCLGQYSVDTIPASLDAVVACPFERLPMGQVEYVVILGAREGLLPAHQGGSGLLSERERERLALAGITLTQNAAEMAFEAQSYIYRTLACPKKLVLTAPQTGEKGAECRPSFILRRIEALSGQPVMPADRLLWRAPLSAPVPALEAALRAVGQPDEPVAAAARRRLSAAPEARARLSAVEAWAAAPRAPIRDPALIGGIYGRQLSMTASRVERIAACRFSYFMQYGLRARERREARFGAPEIGSFVHGVVEQAIARLCSQPKGDVIAITQRAAAEYLESELRGKALTARLEGIFKGLGPGLEAIVRNVWEEIRASDFKPLWFELNFSAEGDLPPLKVETPGGLTAVVGGKIDRVDGWVTDERLYLKVVDYKTGRKDFRLSDLYYDLNLQMFLYLSMLKGAGAERLNAKAAEILGKSAESIAPGAALYIPAKNPWAELDSGADADSIRKSIDKKLERVGIVSSERSVLDALEHAEGDRFRFLPVAFTSKGMDKRSSAADEAQFNALLRRTESTLARLAGAIGGGDIEANPYRRGWDETACAWCEYRPACHFDPTTARDRYRPLPKIDDKEVYDRLEREEREHGH